MAITCVCEDFRNNYFTAFSYKLNKSKPTTFTNLAKSSAYIPIIGAITSIVAIIIISSLGDIVSPSDRCLQYMLFIRALSSVLCPVLLPIADVVGTLWRATYNYRHTKQYDDEILF